MNSETIAAIATAKGSSSVGIIRISGKASLDIAQTMTKKRLAARRATFCTFYGADGQAMDQGLTLFFSAPASFTGEDVAELHTHGGTVILASVLERVCALGARYARPGEFSERAFHNGKIDLVQAEAIADLIASTSRQAARSAMHSLQGRFSEQIEVLRQCLMRARACCEASLDFAAEADAADAGAPLLGLLEDCRRQLREVLARARRGRRLREGLQVVITGAPNAGKSTLLNTLCGEDRAIVAARPGTTRDVISVQLMLEGVCIEVADTAGLRDGGDEVEREGMRRSRRAAHGADILLYVTDATRDDPPRPEELPAGSLVWSIRNKIDLSTRPAAENETGCREIHLSAKTGQGLELLTGALLREAGMVPGEEDVILARQRHMQALESCQSELGRAAALLRRNGDPALYAEHLRLAQRNLDDITGATVPDDVLGEIFSQFCIGK